MKSFKSAADIHDAVMEWGFLPFFANPIEGFSIQEHTPAEYWFTSKEGPWEWKGPVLQMGDCVYGHFLNNKAAFISAEWFNEFANVRRDGYDFDSRMDDGIFVDSTDINIYNELIRYPSILSKGIRRRTGYWGKGTKSSFEAIMSRLQMQTYAIICNFEYEISKKGEPYGWGLARYSTPENYLGSSFRDNVYQHDPQQSYQLIFDHLSEIFPFCSRKELHKMIVGTK